MVTVIHLSAALVLFGVALQTSCAVSELTAEPAEAPPAQSRLEWYAAPAGSPANDGSRERPVDLASALDGGRVKAGSTVWLRGGTYRGPVTSTLTGTPDAPITVRQAPGERAVVADDRARADGATLNIRGAWTIYRDFEITNTNEDRGHGRTFRPMGFEVQAAHTKFINLTVYDTGMGFGFWREAVDSELYGNVIFNSGTENTEADSRHGHGIYAQNNGGTKLLRENIIVNQFGFGIHIYPNPGGQTGFRLEGNIVAESGAANPAGGGARFNNLLVSAYRPYQADRIELVENYTYLSPRSNLLGRFRDANVCLGCADPQTHNSVVVRDNYFAGGSPVALVAGWRTLAMRGNTFVGLDAMAAVTPPSTEALRRWDWDDNTYIGTGPKTRPDALFSLKGEPLSRQEWIMATGFDRASTFRLGRPTGTRVFVRPNDYEAGRGHIVVYNWDLGPSVAVGLGSILKPGTRYEIRSAMDYRGEPIAAGVYKGGPVTLSMSALRVAAPRGGRGTPTPTPGEFGVFVVRTAAEGSSITMPAPAVASAPVASAMIERLDMLVGRYVSRSPRGDIRVRLGNNGLEAAIFNEPNRPVFALTQVSPGRFQVEGAPGFFAVFEIVDGAVRSLILERGSEPSVTLFPQR
jgi:hypothetical protein